MPLVPDTSFSNVAPVARDLGALAGTNDAADAVALTSTAYTGGAPAAHAIDAAAFNNAAAGAIDVAAGIAPTPDRASPVRLDATVADNATPDGIALEPTGESAEPPQPILFNPLASPTDDTVNTPVINLPGMFALNAILGQTRMPAACAITRAQLQLAEAPQGAAVEVKLVDSDGVLLGVTLTVPAGQTFAETVPGAPINLLAAANVRAKVTGIGSTEGFPGGFGVVTLFTQLAA